MGNRHTVLRTSVMAGCLMMLLVGAFTGCASDQASRRAARPALSERVSQSAVTGELATVGSGYLTIRQSNGELQRVHVDDSTKMDRVTKGDRVKAYIESSGHATTVQRVD